jgi:hypothetical protein
MYKRASGVQITIPHKHFGRSIGYPYFLAVGLFQIPLDDFLDVLPQLLLLLLFGSHFVTAIGSGAQLRSQQPYTK